MLDPILLLANMRRPYIVLVQYQISYIVLIYCKQCNILPYCCQHCNQPTLQLAAFLQPRLLPHRLRNQLVYSNPLILSLNPASTIHHRPLASQPPSPLVTATSNHRSQREFLGLLDKHLRVHFLLGLALTLGVIFRELMYLLVMGILLTTERQ